MSEEEKRKPGVIECMLGGMLLTLALVVAVPLLCEHILSPIIYEYVGGNTFLWLSSSALASALMWILIIGFTILLGGGTVLRRYGAVGVLGLIGAYALLGDVRGAVIPVITLVAVWAVLTLHSRRRVARECEPE